MIRRSNLRGCKLWHFLLIAVVSFCFSKIAIAQKGELDFVDGDRLRVITDVSFEKLPSEKEGVAKAIATNDDLPKTWWSDTVNKQVTNEIKKQAIYSLDDLIILAL